MHRSSPALLAESGHVSDSSIPSTSNSSLHTVATFHSPQLPRRSQARAQPLLQEDNESEGVVDASEDTPLALGNGSPTLAAEPSMATKPAAAPAEVEPPASPTSPAPSELRHRRRGMKHPQVAATLIERHEDHMPSRSTLACDFGRTLLDEVRCMRLLRVDHCTIQSAAISPCLHVLRKLI